MDDVRALAFLLPQFHPVPENDRWWGPGFTEWTNVVRARPQFAGHEQPHLPADLGFYDLRLPDTRAAQAEMARAHGIAGFCWYHYWFDGKRLLERPFDEVLRSGEPDFPFSLCWANEAWTRAWDGDQGDVLMPQRYSRADDLAHIRWLCEAFADERYIRVDGKPVFLVYRASDLPYAARTIDTWRTEADRLGIGDLFLGRVESGAADRGDPRELGFDVAVEFQPDWPGLRGGRLRQHRRWRLARSLHLTDTAHARHRVYSYEQVVERMLLKPPAPYPRLPSVTPRWDNTARRADGATVFAGSTPALYEGWLREVVRRQRQSELPDLVFVNAWNEWAEGNHLEPCFTWGHGYLDATRRGLAPATAPVSDAAPDVAPSPPEPTASRSGRLSRSASYRSARARRRLAGWVREATRPAVHGIERVPLPRPDAGLRLHAAPPFVLLVIYRSRNAPQVHALVDRAEAAGAAVALWALDAVEPSLAPRTVGTGAGCRTDLINELVSLRPPGPDEYVVVADDDIEVAVRSLEHLVSISHRAGLGLAQPAHARSSRAFHRITRVRVGSVARRTKFVEIGPVLVISPAWRDAILPLPAGYGMGWGLELEWTDLAERGCVLGIVDAVQVRHLGPIAATYDDAEERERLDRRLSERGVSSLAEVQQTLGTWWRWRRSPPWPVVRPPVVGAAG